MPAVTLKQRTTQSSQNCGVLMAFAAETWPRVIIVLCLAVDGSHPGGDQPSAGTRIRSQPSDMNTA